MRILSVDGGGFLGLAVATLLRDLETHFGVSFHRRFDMFCGTSTGSIIALGLASGLSAARIAELYERLGSNVFGAGGRGSRLYRAIRSIAMAKYGNTALKAALWDVFHNRTIRDLEQSGKRVLIPAFCVTNGRPRVFKTDLPPALTLHGDYRIADIALASSAAPVYLPMVKLARPTARHDEEVFCDGGVAANHPALLAFAEALGTLGVAPGDIALLSIATPRIDLSEPLAVRRGLSRGLARWAPTLSSAFIDSSSTIMHEALRRIVSGFPPGIRPLYARIDLDNRSKLPMDLASADATLVLKQTGAEAASDQTVRAAVSRFMT